MPAGVFQMGGRTLVTQDEADARYQAAQDWFDQYGHLVISNGPFFLARYDPPAQFAELDAFRDPTYPFTAADFDLGPSPTLSIDPHRWRDGRHRPGGVVHGDRPGTGHAGAPVPAARSVHGHGRPERRGDAGTTPGTFTVTLGADVTTGLFPGLYRLDLCRLERRDGAHQRTGGGPRGDAVAGSVWRPLAVRAASLLGVLLVVLVLLVVTLGATGYSDRILGAVVNEEMRGLRTTMAQTIRDPAELEAGTRRSARRSWSSRTAWTSPGTSGCRAWSRGC